MAFRDMVPIAHSGEIYVLVKAADKNDPMAPGVLFNAITGTGDKIHNIQMAFKFGAYRAVPSGTTVTDIRAKWERR